MSDICSCASWNCRCVGEQFARELLAVALRALLHRAEVLAQVVELRRHGQDLVLQLRARRRVPALDAGGVELRQRQRHHLDRPRLQVEIGVGKFGQLAGHGARACRRGQRREIERAIARGIHVSPKGRRLAPRAEQRAPARRSRRFAGGRRASAVDTARPRPRRARSAVRARVVPARRRVPRHGRASADAGEALGKRAQGRRDDRQSGLQRDRQRVRVGLRNLRREQQHVGLLRGDQPRQLAVDVLAVDRERRVRRLRDRLGRRTQHAEHQRQPAIARVARARRDDVQSLFRRQVAEDGDAHDARRRRRRRFRMRPDVDRELGKVALHPRRPRPATAR